MELGTKGPIVFLTVCVALMLNVVASQRTTDDFLGDVKSCSLVCASTYADSKSGQEICQRGCRLMWMIDFMAQDTINLEESRNACWQSCKEAYAHSSDNASACAFGCQSQMPSSEMRRSQLASYFDDQMAMMSPWSMFHSHYSRMMDCMMDRVRHDVGSFRWYFYSQPNGDEGRVSLIVSVGGDRLRGFNHAVIEQKTSSYLETNLASVDRAATPNLSGSQLVDGLDLAVENGDDPAELDWLMCLERRTGASKRLILSALVVALMAVVCFSVGVALLSYGSSQAAASPKLSIYGDLDYLTTIDDKSLLIPVKPQDPYVMAAPLPVKIPINQI